MEQIRRSKDTFKIIFLVTCVETLQNLSKNDGQKKALLFQFFEEYTSDAQKKYIRDHFTHCPEYPEESEDSFQQFIGMLNECRNAAIHEAEYWESYFTDSNSQTPQRICMKIDLNHYSPKNKTTECFETTLSYKDFETIFVHACITFICKYTTTLEDKINADT